MKSWLKIGRSYPLNADASSPVCCGSSIGTNIKTEATGDFTRKVNGNSFKVKNAPASDYDIFPPSRISNFKISVVEYFIIVEFTSPGDDYDDGIPER